MTSLFISYSRRDSKVARRLTEALKDQGLEYWIDWQGIPPTVEWWREIERGIEQADIFLFLLSPDSAKSRICRREIKYAVKNGKRLIPVVVRDTPPNEAPNELRKLNWIFLRETDRFTKSIRTLLTAIQSDYDWAQTHRQLQVKALEWQRTNKENSFLLQGKELLDAEEQLALNSSKEPVPTDLQREYVLLSRQSSDQQRRNRAQITSIVAVVLAALAVFGFVQARLATANAQEAQAASTLATENQRIAEERAKIARAGELSAQSDNLQEPLSLDLSSLLAVEAYDLWDYYRTRSTIANNLYFNVDLRQYLFKHTDWVNNLQFNSKGDLLASGGCRRRDDVDCASGELVFWQIRDGHLVDSISLESHSPIISLAFNPTDSVLATGGCAQSLDGRCVQGEIQIWDSNAHQLTGISLKGHADDVDSLVFSPDGKYLVSGSCSKKASDLCEEGEIIIRSTQDDYAVTQIVHAHTSWINALAYNTDGNLLASGSADGTVIIWAAQTTEIFALKQDFDTESGIVTSVNFSPDGNHLVSSGTDGEIRIWDVTTGLLSNDLARHNSDIHFAALHPNGTQVAAGGLDSEVHIWNTVSGNKVHVFQGHSGRVTSLAYSPDGKYLASAGDDGKVLIWNSEVDDPLGTIVQSRIPNSLHRTYDSKGNILSTKFVEGTVIVVNTITDERVGMPINELPETGFITALSPDGQVLAIGYTNSIALWDLRTGQSLSENTFLGEFGEVSSLAFTSDGTQLAIGGCKTRDENLICHEGIILHWDVASGKVQDTSLTGHESWVTSLAFHESSALLASGSRDDSIYLWDLTSSSMLGNPFLGQNSSVDSIDFSFDGTLLASGGNDGQLILWDVRTSQPIVFIPSNQYNSISSISFHPSRNELISEGAEGNLTQWNVDPTQWRNMTCQRVGRNLTQSEWVQYFPGEPYRITCPQWPAGE